MNPAWLVWLMLHTAKPAVTPMEVSAVHSTAVDRLGESFSIQEGNQLNWFVTSRDAAAHVIVTNQKNPRVLINFPSDNFGMAVWFDPSRNPGLDLRVVGTPTIGLGEGGVQQVSVEVEANRKTLELTDYALDSIRVLRNHGTEERGRPAPQEARAVRTAYQAKHADVPKIWAAERIEVGEDQVDLLRGTLDGREFHLSMRFAGKVNVAPVKGNVERPAGVTITTNDGKPIHMTLQARVPIATLHAYAPHDMLRPEVFAMLARLDAAASAPGATAAVKTDRDSFAAAIRALLFLSSREKYMAGSWRFLTYFGRDTMISLMLLRDILTPRAYSDGIQSVLDRLAADGDVAHEEDLGPFAELRHIYNPRLEGALSTPVYDYKMIDDDVLLPIMEALYLTDTRIALEERRAFVARNAARILLNWNFVVERATSWAKNDGRNYKDLIRIRPNLTVGNWRDSDWGLGHGAYPSDVNVDLMPQALVSIRLMVASGLMPPDALKGYPKLANALGIEGMAAAWSKAAPRFRVTLDTDAARKRVQSFMRSAPLDDAQKDYFLRRRFSDGSTVEDFIHGTTPNDLQAPLVFPSLSLDDRGEPIPVMNLDFGFRLFFEDPSPAEVSDLLRLVELPYPIGLMTPVGPLVANAAYSPNPQLWRNLSRDSYHGAVIWSWQASLLESGLMRQLERFRRDPAQAELAQRLERAVNRQIEARRAAGALAGSELWTWDIRNGRLVALAFGQREGSDTESNAVQLWSTIFPALYVREQKMGVGGKP